MSQHTHTSMNRRRNRLRALAALLLVGTAVVVSSTLASASPAPTATAITVTGAATPGITPPSTPGAGDPYLVKGTPFDVSFITDLPLSYTQTTRVVLRVSNAPATDTAVSASYDVPARATYGTVSGIVLPAAASGVVLTISVDQKKPSSVTPGRITVDVLRLSLQAPASSSLTGFGGGGGPGVPCSPSPSDQVCGDLIVPTSGATTDQLLSQGAPVTFSCGTTSCSSLGSFVQALVGLNVTRTNPARLVAKCDKTLCAGKGIKSYSFYVKATPASPWTLSPACASKGVVATGTFCTDYVQSTRDNAGDLLLNVLFTEDLKGIIR